MGKKKKKKIATNGMVYSTDPDFDYDNDEDSQESLAAEDQYLVVKKDKKQRRGKIVTLVLDYEGPEDDLKNLAKELKSLCGTGGSAKDGEIIIQGDFLEKIYQHLTRSGYNVKKIG